MFGSGVTGSALAWPPRTDARSSRGVAPVGGRNSAPKADAARVLPDDASILDPLRLKERRDFLAAARAASTATPGAVLQARLRSARDRERIEATLGSVAADRPRIGFTASKKVGNAVLRNRAKRRLRALAAELAPVHCRAGWDYVLIARAEETVGRGYARMREELANAFQRVHDPARARARPKRRGGRNG